MPETFESPEEIRDRINRIVAGEEQPPERYADAGKIPAYYGADATAFEVSRAWQRMWAANKNPLDDAFYQSNTIGWASRD